MCLLAEAAAVAAGEQKASAAPTAPAHSGAVNGDTADSGAAQAATKLALSVEDQSDGVVNFTVKPTVPMSKIMSRYAEAKGVDLQSLRFAFDGQRLGGNATPQALGMEDGDVLHVFVEQIGG